MLPSAIVVVVLTVAQIPASTSFAQHDRLALTAAKPNAATVPCYGLFELTLDLKATYDNPFNPEDIDVKATFIGPDGATFRVNGFLAQPHERHLDGKSERIEPTGNPVWLIRFAANREGTWRYQVSARNRSGTVSLPEASFTATTAPGHGFIRTNAKSPHIFAFDDGQPFVAIGENMGWSASGRGTYDFEDWFGGMSRAGGNWARMWLHRWHCCLEWGSKGQPEWEKTSYEGLGVYNLSNAWKIDKILDLAEQNGVYMMLTLGTYGELTDGGFFKEGLWAANPLNTANGGPCAKPDEVWTNEQARKFYRQRLRYVAARYGWRSSVFAWEFWNEANAPAPWVQEMAQFLRGTGPFAGDAADPYKHLISTTYGKPEVWKIPEVDFTQTHHYGEGNIADSGPVIHADAMSAREFGKPHFMAEFGIDWRSSDDKYDPEFHGVNLHNGLWASTLSGNAGGAMIWYWDSYVHPGNLYSHFMPLRKFVDRIPWQEGPWTALNLDAPVVKVDNETWRDLLLAPVRSWGKDDRGDYTIKPLDSASGAALPTFHYGPIKPDLRVPLVLHVDYETKGRFEIRVNAVSTNAKFRIQLDGATAFEKALSAAPPEKEGVKPEYESTRMRPEYNSYEALFNKRYGIDVPAGKHTITIETVDGDWFSASEYVFGQYVSNRYPHMNVYGLTNGKKACLWAQNADHTWMGVKQGKPVEPIRGATIPLRGLPPGRYTCTWWDTTKGEPTGTAQVTSEGDTLLLPLPDLAEDIAAILEP